MIRQPETTRQNIEQQRGNQAWRNVLGIKELSEGIRKLLETEQDEEQRKRYQKQLKDYDKLQKEYRALVRGLNAMIQINGLGQTLGFLDAKGKQDNQKAHFHLLTHLTEWMQDHFKASNTHVMNDQNPNPVTFLTVTETTFAFALALRSPSEEQYAEDVKQARKWLQEALQKYGVGGKTSAGYGFFQEPHELELTASTQQTQPMTAPPPSASLGLTQQKIEPTARVRPNIRPPTVGQVIQGTVIASTGNFQQYVSFEGKNIFLRYMEYKPQDIFMVISSEHREAQNWKEKEPHHCEVVSVEEHDECIVVVCKPKKGKNKDKKKL